MEKVFIIILNWNGKDDTLKCLESVEKLQNTSYKLQAIVVDNGSSDESAEEIEKRYKDIKILKNTKNLGFSAGNNVGIKYALENGADRVIILNNDTVVPKNFLGLLENEADIAGPVIKFKHAGRWVYDYGGYLNWWIGRPKHSELPHHTLYPIPYTIHYLSGCCLAVKRVVFERIGLFDERFFLYFEDVDFCLRAKKAGFKIALDPNVVIFHKLGGSAGRWSKTSIFHNLRSNFIFITKHLGWRRPIGYLYLMLLGIKIIISNIHLGGVHSTFVKTSVDKSATSEVLRRPK